MNNGKPWWEQTSGWSWKITESYSQVSDIEVIWIIDFGNSWLKKEQKGQAYVGKLEYFFSVLFIY